MLPGTPRAAFDQGRSLVTAFRSPVTAAPFRSLHSGVKVSGLLLRSLPLVCAARSDFRSTTAPGSPQSAAASSRQSRCRVFGRFEQPLPRSPLPFGTITSLRIKAFNRLGCRSARLPNSPDYLLLPAATLLLGAATDHRSWFATFPEACCSSNPSNEERCKLLPNQTRRKGPVILGVFANSLPPWKETSPVS
jgi:hypothetical protein